MEVNVPLPPPRSCSALSVEEALRRRCSIRSYLDQPLSLAELGQLLWSAQGIHEGRRCAPSAGATYPLEAFAVVGRVEDLEPGVYQYLPLDHALSLHLVGDQRLKLSRACLDQRFIAQAPLSLLISAQYERTTLRYGERGVRYVHMEVGHVGQNVALQALSLGLDTVMIGAFWDDQVAECLKLPPELQPLCVIPVGRRTRGR